MTRSRRPLAVSLAVVLAGLFVLFVPAAHAGPPLICHPLDIGGAASLPWGSGPGWNTPLGSYDRSRLTADTLALLSPATPIRVRMETLRRATIYAMDDPARGRDLLARLDARTRERGADPDHALALFDLGYLIESFKQARMITNREMVEPSRDGEELVSRARQGRQTDPDMAYAAELIAGGKPGAKARR